MGCVRLHRVVRSNPERIYRAFIDPDALSKWLPPFGFICKVLHFEPRVGGAFRIEFKNFANGKSHSFGGNYLELVPERFIKYTDVFDDPGLPGEISVSVSLERVVCGTALTIVQEGIPDVIPTEMCYLGWQDSLTQLTTLVEPDVVE